MGEHMRVDSDELRDAAPVFHRQSDQLHDALTTLHSRLAALGAPWGDDEQGNKFHAKYGPAKEDVDTATRTLVTGMESIGDALKSMAENHDENELATKDAFDSAAKER
ncbi:MULTISPECIES: WXG100 family type VII secretion target [unclassified Streptomyces]|uniref:WXG100 family type VII secretion target n=1 Tax=unclassified Streptomyces TaxID=2593676 RepID=UPI00278C15D2|nr:MULTISPECIES: WXG100 family type VII secretion target [unclassified Streptomyces]